MSNDSVRRIMAEVKEFTALNKSPTTFFHAFPLESDLFEWHFSVRGPPDTAFSDGVYHGRIVLPAEYPLKPPEIIMLTPNGRFEVGKRICLSVTAHHQETWQPSWGIRTILTALVGFMPTKAEGIGALDFPQSDRRRLARLSWSFTCNRCHTRPIEQLHVPAAVESGFPGAFIPPNTPSSSSSSSSSTVKVAAAPAVKSSSSSSTSNVPTATVDSDKKSKDCTSSSSQPINLTPSSPVTATSTPTSSTPSSSLSTSIPITPKTLNASGSVSNSEQQTNPSISLSSDKATDSTVPSLSETKNNSTSTVTTTSSEPSSSSLNTNSTSDTSNQFPDSNFVPYRTFSNPVDETTEHSTTPSTSVATRQIQTQSSSSSPTRNVQEPELLYLAYAIVVAIVAIILRRVYVVVMN